MVEECAIGHEIAGVEDNRWQHVEEEGGRCQWQHPDAVRVEEQQSDGDADHDEQT